MSLKSFYPPRTRGTRGGRANATARETRRRAERGSARAGARWCANGRARNTISLVLVVMLCSRELRRKKLLHFNQKQRELTPGKLDENRVKFTTDGKFQPDWKEKSHVQLLVEHALMNTDFAAYRSYPKGYLEFLVQLRGYKQKHFFKMPRS